MFLRALTSLALVATVSACATQAPFVHTKTSISEGELFADSQACQAMAKSGGASGSAPAYNPALPSQAGAAFGAGIAQGIAQARAQKVGYETCMAERGYLQTTLTPAELKAYRALRTEAERKAWMQRFAGQDHASRSTTVPAPKPCKPNILVKCVS
jgi:hypothetical protein